MTCIYSSYCYIKSSYCNFLAFLCTCTFFEYFFKSVILLLLKYTLLEVTALCFIEKWFSYKEKNPERISFCKFNRNWCWVCVPVTVHLIGSGWPTVAPGGEQQSATHTQTAKEHWYAEMETDREGEMIFLLKHQNCHLVFIHFAATSRLCPHPTNTCTIKHAKSAECGNNCFIAVWNYKNIWIYKIEEKAPVQKFSLSHLKASFGHREAVELHALIITSWRLLAPISLLAASAILSPGLCLRVWNYVDLGLWDHVSWGGPTGCKSGLIC